MADEYNYLDGGMYGPPVSAMNAQPAASGGSFLDGLGNFLGYAGKAYVDVKAADARARTQLQYDPLGGYYVAGRANQSAGGMSPLLLLLLVGGLVVALRD